MKKPYIPNWFFYIFYALLAVLPFSLTYQYLNDAFIYQNSPHLSTVWDKSDPMIDITKNKPLRQVFEVSENGLDKIDIRLRKGAGQYRWSIKKDPSSEESIETGNFTGNHVQNYDFLSLKFEEALDAFVGQTLWLVIERRDQRDTPSVSAFTVMDAPDTVVFQLYYNKQDS